MSKKLISGFLVDVSNPTNTYAGKAVWDHTDGYQKIYDLLKCDTFTIATRKFGQFTFDIYLDDEGLLKNNQVLTGLSLDMKEQLVGNLFVVSHDDNGEVVSLTDNEIKYLHLYFIAGLLRYSF